MAASNPAYADQLATFHPSPLKELEDGFPFSSPALRRCALAPTIAEPAVQLHRDKHPRTCVTSLNGALERCAPA